jgi:hypothetical protein
LIAEEEGEEAWKQQRKEGTRTKYKNYLHCEKFNHSIDDISSSSSRDWKVEEFLSVEKFFLVVLILPNPAPTSSCAPRRQQYQHRLTKRIILRRNRKALMN